MKRIFLFPTVDEAKGFLVTNPRDPVFVAGEGMAEMAAATVRAVKARKPHLAVLCGLADAADDGLRIGEVVEVVSEQEAGFDAEYFADGPDTGLPPAAGLTVAYAAEAAADTGTDESDAGEAASTGADETDAADTRAEETSATPAEDACDSPTAITTGEADAAACGECTAARPEFAPTTDAPAAEPPLPLVIDREGAAFFAVCEALGVACCQIRAVAGYAGHDREAKDVELALNNLTETLTRLNDDE